MLCSALEDAGHNACLFVVEIVPGDRYPVALVRPLAVRTMGVQWAIRWVRVRTSRPAAVQVPLLASVAPHPENGVVWIDVAKQNRVVAGDARSMVGPFLGGGSRGCADRRGRITPVAIRVRIMLDKPLVIGVAS